MKIALKAALAIAGISLLTACGGGGGGSGGSTAAAPTLNLKTAFASMIANGSSAAYTLSGDCSGTSVRTSLPSYSATNYSNVAASVVENLQTDTISVSSKSYSKCADVFNSNNGGQVYTDFYSPSTGLIIDEGGSSYWNVYSGQTALPTSVTAGSTGTMYTYKNYNGASSTSAATQSTGTVTYSVAADSATTLLVTVTDTSTLTSANAVQYIASTTYRLNANNTLTPISETLNITSAISAGPLSVTGTALAAPTLNVATAQSTALLSGGSGTLGVSFNGTACSGSFTSVSTALSNLSNTETTTSNVVSNTCGGFSNNEVVTNVYGSSYQLLSSVAVGSGSSTTTATNSVALPSSATVGTTGKLYDFTKGTTGQAADENGTAIYFIGADSATTLMAYQIRNDYNIASGVYQRRLVQAYRINANNTSAYSNGYFTEGNTWYFKPL